MWPPSYSFLTCLRENPSVWCWLFWSLLFLSVLLFSAGAYALWSIRHSLRLLNSKRLESNSDSTTNGSAAFLPEAALSPPPPLPIRIKASLLILALAIGIIGYRVFFTPTIGELHNVYVIRDLNAYDYKMRTAEGIEFFTRFCPDYEPQFSAGQTLTVLKYEDRGACWSVARTHPAYLIKRDDNGNPIIQ